MEADCDWERVCRNAAEVTALADGGIKRLVCADGAERGDGGTDTPLML